MGADLQRLSRLIELRKYLCNGNLVFINVQEEKH